MAEEIPEGEDHVITHGASLFTVHSGGRTWYLAICDALDLSTSGTDRDVVIKDLMEYIAISQGIEVKQVSVRDKTAEDGGGYE